MKFRCDFVTNSSSSSYVFIGFYSPELLAYLRELIQAGYTYRYKGEETSETKGYIATNAGDKAVVDALTFIPYRRNIPEKVGFQVEMSNWGYDRDAVDALMSFIDPNAMSEEELVRIRNKFKKLTEAANEKGQILQEYGEYSTDASDFAYHFNERDYDRVLYEISRQRTLISCKDKNTVDAIVYDAHSRIKEKAFQNMKQLKSVSFKHSVHYMKIGARAFAGCEALEYVDMIASTDIIGDAAFLNCCNLKGNLDFSSVKEIGNRAFEGCKSITEVQNLKYVLTIGKAAFKGCSALKEIDLPERMFEIGEDAFAGCPDLVIVCKEGSYAHAYARTYNIPVRLK